MTKINRHIEIVSSTKRGLSSMGATSCQAVQTVLAEQYDQVYVTTVNNLSDLRALVARRPDVVFLGMKFIPSDPALGLRDPHKIWLSEYLEEHGITHTGSDYQAHELELNKEYAKHRVWSSGLKTARFYVARVGEPLTPDTIKLRYPVFIKPTNRGGGLGIDSSSVAYDFSQLSLKVDSLAASLDCDSLIEEYLPGREFSVAILKDIRTGEYDAMPLELVAPADRFGERFLSAQVKLADTERNLPVTDPALRAQVNALAIAVFDALGARDYGRIDIRLDAQGVSHFLEANLLPSLLEGYGNFPKACLLNAGLSFRSMLTNVVELAVARSAVFEDNLTADDQEDFLPVGPLNLLAEA